MIDFDGIYWQVADVQKSNPSKIIFSKNKTPKFFQKSLFYADEVAGKASLHF